MLLGLDGGTSALPEIHVARIGSCGVAGWLPALPAGRKGAGTLAGVHNFHFLIISVRCSDGDADSPDFRKAKVEHRP